MRLPNHAIARINIGKLSEYVLNPAHAEGRHKARVFLSALGLNSSHAKWLADAILKEIGNAEAVLQATTVWGTIYRADLDITRGQRCARIRTAWMCTANESRLVTCFVIGGCNENT